MSELDDIAAAAGIVIVDKSPGDGGDTGFQTNDVDSDTNKSNSQQVVIPGRSGDRMVSPEVTALEALFGHRYTMEDPDYAQTVHDAEFTSQPPCVRDYRGRRSREDNRHRGGRGYGRGHHYGNRYNQDRDDHRSWHHRDGGDRRDHYRDRSRDSERY